MDQTPDTQKSSAKFTLIAIIVLILIAVAAYFYFSKPPETTNNPTSNTYNTEMVTIPAGGANDDTPNEVEEASPSVDTSTWVRVPEDGYEFMHPDYFIKQENDYYIIAPEPVQGGEFSGVAIHKPFEITDIEAYLQETIDNKDASVGVNVTTEPHKISSNGSDTVYLYEYESESGYNTGPGKFYAIKSPYTDEWVTIEYAVHPNAEAIRESFRFMRTQ